MITRAKFKLSIAPLWILAASVAGLSPAVAKTCSGTVVTARGEPASFMWLAKTKARGNWRLKVRSNPDLGPDYSTWGKAETSEERCITAAGGTVCIFSGYPCRD
jgi:hypothetical protein